MQSVQLRSNELIKAYSPSMDKDVIFNLNVGSGDEVLRIGTCHQVMANASPVFKVMLDGDKFREGGDLRKTGYCEIPLVETHAGAFQVLCQIFHLQGHMVCSKMDVNLLYEIASLVDRYDCLTSIQPWPRIWVQENSELFDFYSSPISSGDLSASLKMIHIASVFRLDTIFTNATTYFLRNVRAADFSEPVLEQLYNNLIPDVQDFIFMRLDTCRQGMKKLAIGTIVQLEAGDSCKDPRSLEAVNRFNCSSMLLGNALLSMRDVFGVGWKKAKLWEKMPIELYEPMLRFAHALSGPKWVRTREAHLRGHNDCTLDKTLVSQIEMLYNTACKPPTLADLKDAIAMKGTKSGRVDWQTVLDELLLDASVVVDDYDPQNIPADD